MDTIRNKAALLALLNDNKTGDISAQDMRDVVVTMYHDMEAMGVLGPYLYIAYAIDSLGTGFTTTFNGTYNYIAFLNSPTEILTLVQSDFNGLWSKYKGGTGSGGSETLQQVTDNGNITSNSIFLNGITDGLNKISLHPIDNGSGLITVYNNSGVATTTISGTNGITSVSFIKNGGTSSQFLKADGSVDSTTYQTSLINGLADVLSINTSTGNLPITSPSGLNYLQINDTDFYAESGISNKGFLQMHEAFAAIGNNDGAFLVSDNNLLYYYGKFQIRTLYSEIRHTTKVQINAPIITLSQNGVGALEAVTVQQLTTVANASVLLAGSTMTGSLILNGDPTSANMAVNKNYVDQNLNGLNWKRSVLYSTTSGENLSLTGLTATIDGTSRTLSNTDRILVKNQTNQVDNGIYNPNAAAWTRTTDSDISTELLGATVYVLDGSIEKNRVYAINVSPITLGATNITFALISGVGTYTNGLYLKLTGNVFDIDFTTFATSNITEGTNLYYTQARFDNAFSAKSTTNLTEGTNLYYTQARFDTAFTLKTTTDLTEGTNLYYTQARFDTAFTLKTTTDLTEGTNLYFTNNRAISSTLTGYSSGTGTITSADSILSAIQKLNGNISVLVTGVSTVSGTINRITSTGGSTPVIDIASTYVGQSSITTLGTITTGTWNGTAITNANLANSSITVGTTSISLGFSSLTLAGLTSVASTTFVGALTGNASTATVLQTARTINGASFDGSVNITITADASTLTGTVLNSTVVTSSLTSVGTLTSGSTSAGFTISLGTSTVTGTLGIANGGTSFNSYTTGDILYASATNVLSKLPIGTSGQQLTVVSGVPTWSNVSTGTVTSVSVVTANGISGSVATSTTTPAITLSLGAITPSSVNGNTFTTGTGTLTLSTFTLNVTGTSSINGTFSGTSSGTNTGDQTITLTGEATGSGTGSFVVTLSNASVISKLLTGYVSGAGTISSTDSILSSIQKLNGNIAALATGVSSVNGLTGSVPLTGTANRITINASNVFDISASYTGQASITTLGTITAGVWNGTAIANANLANSSITLGSTLLSLGTIVTTIAGLTSVTSTTFVGALTGNASTATVLQTARTINGTSFDGSANITITADANTLTGTALNSTVVSSSLTAVSTITSGVWNATTINTTYTDAKIKGSVTATAGLIPFGTGTADTVTTDSNIMWDNTNKRLGVGTTPTAKIDISSSTTANASLRLRTGIAPTSPNAGDTYQDGTHAYMYLNSTWKILDTILYATVNTTDANPTTLQTIAIPTNSAILIESRINSIKTGGTGTGTTGGTNSYIRVAKVKNVGGTVTLGTISSSYTNEDIAPFNATFVVSGTNVIVQVTGAASDNVTWTTSSIITQ